MEMILAIAGGLGIGSLLTQAVLHFLQRKSKKDDVRTERLEQAFASLLVAYTDVIKNADDRNHQLTFAMWEARIQLIASDNVVKSIQILKQTAPHTPARGDALEKMIAAMRNDLGIAK
ncbi:hypothetical protein [Shewanella khirikhana]|uniref:hypothetical protein n=1 Tax=Shewanella khirikhana TaxID=1965282 RepID=UPI000F7F15F8|nr:hypothetical protein [Shewanella khirikhana]